MIEVEKKKFKITFFFLNKKFRQDLLNKKKYNM